MEIKFWLTVLVLLALGGASYGFNWYIDRSPALADGVTSYRVAFGTAYTLVGVAAIVWIWTESTDAATITLAASFASFAAAGIPMMYGDVNRSQRNRSR